MEGNTGSVSNLVQNLSKKQKLGIAVLIVVIVVLAMVFAAMANQVQEDISGNPEEEQITVETATGVSGDSISGGSDENGDGNGTEAKSVEVPVSTDYNERHEYTLSDYLPASKHEYVDYGDDESGIVDYWWVTENTVVEKGIVVSADDCDEKENTAAANEFLSNLPVDLSEYTIVYQTHTGSVPCDVR